MEWQDLVWAAILPAAHEYADREFVHGANDWFDEDLYINMCQATGHDPASAHKKLLLSHDSDSRHSYNQHCVVHGRPVIQDRRELAPGTKQAIPLHRTRDYVPLCPRVPDCIQSPIEMVFAPIKREFRKVIGQRRRARLGTSPQVVIETALQAFKEKGSVENVNSCWKHASKSLLVWTTPCDQWVKIDNVWYMGVGGNWVPKSLAG